MTEHKYYHGTSSIYLKSIREKGLGGINPNLEYRLLDLLKMLYEFCEEKLLSNEEYQKERLSTQCMAEQRPMSVIVDGREKIFNFRHEGIYVAYSIERAVVYAATNAFGSEILTRCVFLYNLIRKHYPYFEVPIHLNSLNIQQLDGSVFFPVIIEMTDIDPDDLAKEDGKTAKEALEFLENLRVMLPEKAFFEFKQYCNFELLKPIPTSKLKFYRLHTVGSIRDLKTFDYRLEPLQ